jgi:hypothetical protein
VRPDCIQIEVQFDRPLDPADVVPMNAVAAFAAQLRPILLEGAEGGGPWGFGSATVTDVRPLLPEGVS